MELIEKKIMVKSSLMSQSDIKDFLYNLSCEEQKEVIDSIHYTGEVEDFIDRFNTINNINFIKLTVGPRSLVIRFHYNIIPNMLSTYVLVLNVKQEYYCEPIHVNDYLLNKEENLVYLFHNLFTNKEKLGRLNIYTRCRECLPININSVHYTLGELKNSIIKIIQ